MEEIDDKRLYITTERDRKRERERACVLSCILYYNTKLWAQFYVSGLLGNRDGSDQSAHLRNLIRLFFFAYHLRWTYIPKTHSGLQKIQKNTHVLHVAGYCNAEITLQKAIVYLSVSNIYIALCIKYLFSNKT